MIAITERYYPLKVWIATIFTASLLQVLFIVLYLGHGRISDFFSSLLFLIPIGAAVSIPALLLFILAFSFLNPKIKSIWLLKLLLTSFCLTLFLLTDYSIQSFFNRGFEHLKSKFFIVAYSVCIVFFGGYYGRKN